MFLTFGHTSMNIATSAIVVDAMPCSTTTLQLVIPKITFPTCPAYQNMTSYHTS